MLGVLLESRARRQRRPGGAALSVAVHIAIVGATIAGTAHTVASRPTAEKPTKVVFAHTEVVKPLERHGAITDRVIPALPSNIVVQRIAVPNVVPKGLPPIDIAGAITADSIILGGTPGVSRGGGGDARGILAGDDDDGSWNANEVFMHIVTSVKPRYPESLRNANIDGRVLVRFTVDTLGSVSRESMTILESTHDLFSRAVKDALAQFRFKPAMVGTRKVAAVAEMPFEFRITK
jgi:TonB family protein